MNKQEYEQHVALAAETLVDGLRRCGAVTDQRMAAINCLASIAKFLSIHPIIESEGLLDVLTNTALGLHDLGNGIQPKWLMPAPRQGGSPKPTSVEVWIKLHTVSMVRTIKSLGDEGGEVEEVSACLGKAGYQVRPTTIKKWVSKFNTLHRQSPERNRQDKMVENLLSLDLTKQAYLNYFMKTVRTQLRST